MMVIMGTLIVALFVAISLLPADVSFFDAVRIAGAAGRLNAVDTHFDWNNRYNLWSGLIASTFLFLSYFGTDQSQVQRYLTGKSIGQSRLSLLFNAVAKVPVQFFILFIGAMVFVFFLFVRPPLVFHPGELKQVESSAEYASLDARQGQAFEHRQTAARHLKDARDAAARTTAISEFRTAQAEFESAHQDALKVTGEKDTNYIFLSFVTHYLPRGLVGLIIGVIFTAAMSAISGEINSLATVTVIDVYRRHFKPEASDHHYLTASRVATVFWGIYAVVVASYAAQHPGALIEVVNQVGSYFYGSMLGVFVVAFFLKRVSGTAAFAGTIVGQASIFATSYFTNVAYLWFNVIGCLVVIVVALGVSYGIDRKGPETGLLVGS
jgi:Na+/proline symporter